MLFKQFFLYAPLSVFLDIRYWFVRMVVRTEIEQSSLKIEDGQNPLFRYIAFLQAELPRHPYWCSGHKALAELYLKINAIDLAYTAAHSYKALLPEKKSGRQSIYLAAAILKSDR